MEPHKPIVRILVVDDSAFARKAVREMLANDPSLEVVGTARDGEDALRLVEELKPDIVTCDINMPRLDGVNFVRQQMKRRPLPILLLSSAPEDGEKVLEALQAGAVDLIKKPSALATNDLLEIRSQLAEKVHAAARTAVQKLIVEETRPPALAVFHGLQRKHDVVCIGVSTGGPQALRRILPQISKDFPVPILIVLHMPVGYTALFAEKLNEISTIEVKEARGGELLRPGIAFVAQAGRHLRVVRTDSGAVQTELTISPMDKLHRPAVDVLFQSAADVYGSRTLAVVMTGMGDDGREGAAWVKSQGGTVLTESEISCVIYGMPRSVVEAGLSDATAPLDQIVQLISQHL